MFFFRKNKNMLLFVISLLSAQSALAAIDSPNVAFKWKQVDFDYPTTQDRWDATNSKQFIPENNIPLGLEVYGDRIFITVPRWKEGVAASLVYINKTGKSIIIDFIDLRITEISNSFSSVAYFFLFLLYLRNFTVILKKTFLISVLMHFLTFSHQIKKICFSL